MATIGSHLLGRNLEHDPLSKNFAHPIRTISKPRNVIHISHAPCLDQGDLGSCEGNTAAEFLNCTRSATNRKRFNAGYRQLSRYLTQNEAVLLYSRATALDNDHIDGVYPPTDTGTSGVGIAKAMVVHNAIAKYNWTFTWPAFLATLQTQPVMLGTNWYDSMFDPSSTGELQISPNDKEPSGGHAYLALAIDYQKKRIGCQNHWGADWGVKIGGRPGRFWLSFDTLGRLLIDERGESLVPVLM